MQSLAVVEAFDELENLSLGLVADQVRPLVNELVFKVLKKLSATVTIIGRAIGV